MTNKQDRWKPKPTETYRSSKEVHNQSNNAAVRAIDRTGQRMASEVSEEIQKPRNMEQPEATLETRRNSKPDERTQSKDNNMHE